MHEFALSINGLSKEYRIYQRPLHRIIEAFMPWRRRWYASFAALSGVDITVNPGESVGIIGRNGSGKSTLLQLICGNLQPTAGTIMANGRISALLELGAGFNPEFTGRENVYLNTAIQGLSRLETDQRFQQIADFAEIGDFIDRPVKTYSSGMYVRLAFATAVNVDPEILIVDEALAVGDIFFQQKCIAHMKKMMEKATIVFVSHDMNAVSNLCQRVIVMESGKKIFDGATEEGIALYTRLVHNGLFRKERKAESLPRDVPVEVAREALAQAPDFAQWIAVPEESLGGAGEASIVRVSITSDGIPPQTVQQGQEVTVRMLVLAQRPFTEAIFGYTIRDRFGMGLFGENSLSSLQHSVQLAAGYTIVRYSFVWPEVWPQEYTLTLGMGEGDHPFHHTIQCWAHSIFSFSAIAPGRCVHGLFNNPLENLSLQPVGLKCDSARHD